MPISHSRNATLYAGTGEQYLYGGEGHDDLRGGPNTPTMDGGGGNDTLFGGTGSSVMYGGGGHDVIFSGSGNDILYGDGSSAQSSTSSGNDTYVFMGSFGSDVLTEFANRGVDDRMMFEFAADKVLLGREGNDLFFGIEGQTDNVTVKDWFTNFGIDSFWFATPTEGQYQVLTSAVMAEFFDVQLAGVDTGAIGEPIAA